MLSSKSAGAKRWRKLPSREIKVGDVLEQAASGKRCVVKEIQGDRVMMEVYGYTPTQSPHKTHKVSNISLKTAVTNWNRIVV